MVSFVVVWNVLGGQMSTKTKWVGPQSRKEGQLRHSGGDDVASVSPNSV